MAGPIRIAILANGRGARAELSQTARSAQSMGSVIGRAGRIAATGLAIGLGAAVYQAKQFAVAAAEDETSAKLLERQLRASADATDAQVASTERWITAQGKALGIADDEYRPALAKLVTATKDVNEAQKLAALSADVAAARGLDLATVSKAVARGADGQTTSLSRLGIKTKDAAGEALSFNELVRQMSDQFGGAAKTKAETMQGTLDRLKVRFNEAGEALGARLLPPLADLAFRAIDGVDALEEFANVNIVPKLRDAAKWYRSNKEDLADLAAEVRDTVVPVLGSLVRGTAAVVSTVSGLPGPVRSAVVQLTLATVVFTKLRATIAATSLTGFIGQLAAAETQAARTALVTSKLSAAARAAAGVGGMLALYQSTKQSNDALGTLMSTAGGAALGFSVGGPIGGAIGGFAGLVFGLSSRLKDTRQEAQETYDQLAKVNPVEVAKDKLSDLAATLDQVTGAYTGATRAAVLQKLADAGVIETAAKYGISARQVVNAALGQQNAMSAAAPVLADYTSKIAELDAQQAALKDSAKSYTYIGEVGELQKVMTKDALDAMAALEKEKTALEVSRLELEKLPGTLAAASRETRAAAAATADYSGKLHGIPRAKRTKIEAEGIVPTTRGVANIARRYDLLDRKQVRTLIEASGADTTVKQVQRVIAKIEQARNTPGNLPKVERGMRDSIQQAEGTVTRGGRNVVNALKRELAKGKADMPRLKPSLNTLLSGAASTGRAGGTGIGTAVEQGFGGGFGGAIASWSASVRAAVRAAIAAGRAEAKAKSPSQETARLGRDLGDGLVIGLLSKQGDGAKAARKLLNTILGQLTGGGASAIGEGLDNITKLVEQRVNLKDDKAERKREREILAALAKRSRALKAIGRQQDALKDGNYLSYLKKGSSLYAAMTKAGVKNLTEARALLDDLRQQSASYAESIRQSFVDFANLTQLGQNAAGKVTTAGLLRDLAARAAAAKRFAVLIAQLRASGLNEESLRQLIAAGPEAGMAAAEAIAAGGASAVEQVNNLMAEIAAAGQQLGNEMSQQFYGAGIAAAEGIVAGLEAAEAELEKVAKRMAKALIKAVKEELGIKSPSRVFRGIGKQTVEGLALGLDNTYVKRQGQDLAAAMVSGFGTPALTAHAALAGGTGVRRERLELHLSSDAVHQLARGRDIVADADAYRAAGGTGRP